MQILIELEQNENMAHACRPDSVVFRSFDAGRLLARRRTVLPQQVKVQMLIHRPGQFQDRRKQIGYGGSYEPVKKFIRPIKEQQARIGYARFETIPGLQAQVDWADFQIAEPNGKTGKI